MSAPEVRKLKLWQNRIETEVEVSGHGPPLVYLHGPWGLGPDRSFVARLAAGNTVYAWSQVLEKAEFSDRFDAGALRLRLVATKDRPCAVVLALPEIDGGNHVVVVPITHSVPDGSTTAMAVPPVKK